MSKAPEKIWYDQEEESAGVEKLSSYEIPYIRADLVDELVEALNNLINATCEICEMAYSDEIEATYINARAALAKVRGEKND